MLETISNGIGVLITKEFDVRLYQVVAQWALFGLLAVFMSSVAYKMIFSFDFVTQYQYGIHIALFLLLLLITGIVIISLWLSGVIVELLL